MESVLKVKGLVKKYPGFTALNGLCMNVPKGSIYGFVGKNGAGKTTLIRVVTGLQSATEGDYEIFGTSSESGDILKARRRMGAIVETPALFGGLNAKDNMKQQYLNLGLPSYDGIDDILELVGLKDTGRKKVKNFSLGMRQRLGLANALMGKPEFMVLDEPINGLDPEGIVEIRELFRKLNKEDEITMVISSHILSELSLLCTDYIFINHGQIKGVFTADELKAACSEYYHIDTDNNEKASAILTKDLGIEKVEALEDGSLRIYEGLDDIHFISKTLYDNGIIPVELSRNEVNLEDYYMRMVQDRQ